jgi:hypothetical protein
MERQEPWQLVLDAELLRWRAKSCGQLITDLQGTGSYEVEHEGRKYQVEVSLLENTNEYIHIGIDVDDGTLPDSFRPLSSSFICRKKG